MPSPASSELFHVTHGQGRLLLAIHGGPGLDHAYLRPWLDALGDRATVVYVDLRGCGRSPRPEEWNHLDANAWTADLEAVREELGHDHWTVFGHSGGGFVALEYARLYPGSVDALILCSMAPSLGHVAAALGALRKRIPAEEFGGLADLYSTPRENDEDFEQAWRVATPHFLHRPTPELVAATCDGIEYSAGAFNRGVLDLGPSFDARPWLGEITIPALVIGGRHDWLYPPAHGAEPLAGGLPNAELVVFEESGHYPFIEEPDRFAAVVSAWLGALPEPTRTLG